MNSICIKLIPSLLLLASAAFGAREDVLLQADREFAQATGARGAEGFISYFAEEVALLPKNSAPVVGKAAAAEMIRRGWAQPGYSLTWIPLHAELAQSGELGYTYGTYERKFVQDGKPATETGKYVTMWKRQRDGKWKVILDMGN
jgi:ketosteroid isomerase-like protein